MDKVIRIASLRNSYTFERRFNDFVYQKALKVLTYIVKLVSPSSISEDLRNEQILSYLQWYQLCQGHKGGKFRFWTAWIFYSCFWKVRVKYLLKTFLFFYEYHPYKLILVQKCSSLLKIPITNFKSISSTQLFFDQRLRTIANWRLWCHCH